MTVTAIRPNKPMRYRYDGNLAVPIGVEEDQPAAQPAEQLSDLLAVLKALLTDQKAALKLVSDAEAAMSKTATATAEQAKAEANRNAALADLARAQAAHTKKLADEKLAHEQAMAARESAVVAKEVNAADLERRATRTLDEAEKLKARLKARLDLVRQAAAE